jgi:hypothetical protein
MVIIMNRRIPRLGPTVGLLVAAVLAMPGCETLQHNLRTSSGRDAPREAEAKAEEASEARGFFKPSRVSGAMSSEGREIEQSLGVR